MYLHVCIDVDNFIFIYIHAENESAKTRVTFDFGFDLHGSKRLKCNLEKMDVQICVCRHSSHVQIPATVKFTNVAAGKSTVHLPLGTLIRAVAIAPMLAHLGALGRRLAK